MNHTNPRLIREWHRSRMVDSIANTLARLVSNGIRDISSEGKLGKNSRVAVKLLRPEQTMDTYEESLKEFIREATLWSRGVHHENVVSLYGVAHLAGSLALISQWMNEGDLGRYLDAYPDACRSKLFVDIASALAHLHSVGIIHGMLQPSSVLVSSTGQACLCSFVAAQSYETSQTADTLEPQPEFPTISNPEAIQADRRNSRLTPQIDVYDFGILILEILMDLPNFIRKLNFITNNFEDLPQRPENVKGLTDELWDVVQSCLYKDPARRPNMAEVVQRLVPLAGNRKTTFKSRADVAQNLTLDLECSKASHNILKDITPDIHGIGEHPIAGGGFCDLYLGDRFGIEKVALKQVRFLRAKKQDQDAARRCFLSEAWLWADLQHPRILPFYGICQNNDLSYFMVSPFLRNGNITEYLGKIAPNANRYRLLHEAAEGLLYLHSRNPPVVHGDMKGANILITDHGTAVLTDFGLSKLNDEETTTILQGAGSPRWMAPELVMSEDQTSEPSKTIQSDVYALGQVMLEVLSGQLPFFNVKNMNVLVHLIQGKRALRPEGPIADKWLDDMTWRLILKYTAIDPQERPIMKMVVSELEAISKED